MKRFAIGVALVLLALTVACQEEEEQVATVTPNPTATATATGEATPTPGPTTADGQIDKSQLQGRIAFYSQSEEGICIMNADGTGVTGKVTSEWSADPAWSPDGEMIAFTRGDNDVGYNIYVVNADGSGERQLTSGRHVWEWADWSPDGKRIAFEARSGLSLGGGHINVMNADGSSVTELEGDQEAFEHCPDWSPDGSRIAFSTTYPYGIGVMNADGSEATRLLESDSATNCPVWSPDGKTIAFETLGPVGWLLQTMNADGTDVTTLRFGVNPAWSPDGRFIAFASWLDTIYVMNRDGSGATHLGEGITPDWSPQ